MTGLTIRANRFDTVTVYQGGERVQRTPAPLSKAHWFNTGQMGLTIYGRGQNAWAVESVSKRSYGVGVGR